MCKKTPEDFIGETNGYYEKYWFQDGVDAINKVASSWNAPRDQRRHWHVDLQSRFKLHPVVESMLVYRPVSWQQVLLEWPHISESDPTRLAYTRDEEHGAQNRQTLTSIGKYIARHWPHVPDHFRRDAACLYTPDTFEILTDVRQMICAIETGPRSCMTVEYGNIGFTSAQKAQMLRWMAAPEENEEPDWELHPYKCYDPRHGWSLAVHRDSKEIMGRALLLKRGGATLFVRTFMHHPENRSNFAVADTALCAWLEAQGFKKMDSWPAGSMLECPDGRAPYIDGDRYHVEHWGGTTWEISDSGHECRNTNGRMTDDEDEDEDCFYCEDCNEREHDDEGYWVGRHGNRHICGSCISEYTEVRGSTRRNYIEYYIPDSDAAYIENQDYYIDPVYPPEYVVELEDGNWAEMDDCVSVGDEWYLCDDDRVVKCESEDPDTGSSYGLREDCWQETESGDWYHGHIEYVTDKDGNLWHPDNAPDEEDLTPEEEAAYRLEEAKLTAKVAALKGQPEPTYSPAQVHAMMAEVTANLTATV